MSRHDRPPITAFPTARSKIAAKTANPSACPTPGPEVSVVIAVRNHEDAIGHQVRAVASHLRSLGRTFEVIAVNDGSRDNSLPILELLAARLPELRVVRTSAAGRAFQRGALEANGGILILVADASRLPLAPLGWALSKIAAGRDAVLLRGRYVVGRTAATARLVARAPGPGSAFERLFERLAARPQPGFWLDVVGSRPPAPTGTSRLLDPLLRFLTVS